MAYKNTVKDYSQMIGFLTRDKTTDVPGSMAHGLRTGLYDGGRVPFAEAPGSVKTKVVDYLDEKELAEKGFDPNRLLSEMTDEEKVNYFQDLTKKQKIAAGIEKKRMSTKIDQYRDAMLDYEKLLYEARVKKDATIIPKSLKSFLESKGLKEGTYGNLRAFNLIPAQIPLPFKARNTLANDIIRDYNDQLKFKELNKILKDAKFTDKEIKAVQAGRLNKADKAGDKARKAYDFIFNNPKTANAEVSQLFNPRALIANLTGLTGETISKKFSVQAYDPEGYDLYTKLGNPKVQSAVRNRQGPMSLITFKNLNKTDPLGSQAKATALRKERLDKATTLAGEGVADINAAQKEVVKLLNDHYKKNPEELLSNTKLRNLLDLTLEDGEIVKKNKYVTDDDFKKLIQDKKGLFTMDHVDEVQFEKLSTEFPIFKQLATYNTNSGLIKSMKAYMSKNQNSKDPAVQNKIKKQVEFLEDLKLRVDTPTGRVGSKEVLAAVDRKAGVLPNFLAQLRALNIKLPAKAKAAVLGIGGGLGATTLATAGPLEETGSTAMDTAKTVAAGTAGAATLGTKTGRKAAGKFAAGAFGPLGLLALNTGLGVDPTSSIDRLGLGLEATFLKDAVKGTIGATKGMKNRALQKGIQRILNAGMSVPTALKVARYASPLGIASLAGEGLYQVGKLGYEDQQRFNALSPEEQAAERAEQEKFAFDIEGS